MTRTRPTPAPPPPAAPAPPPDDQRAVRELVRRAQDGDAEGFGELHDRHVDVVFHHLSHEAGDRATAEDPTSQTLVRAPRRIDPLSC